MKASENTLELEGNLGIDRAQSLKEELAAALAGTDSLSLDLTKVEELELSCLQILYAARKSARAAGKELHLTGAVQAKVEGRLRRSGCLSGPAERGQDLELALLNF